MLVFKPFSSHLSLNICMISLGLGSPLLGYEQYSCLISSKTSKTLNITALTWSQHITPVIVIMVRNTEISFLLLVLHNLSSHQNPAEINKEINRLYVGWLPLFYFNSRHPFSAHPSLCIFSFLFCSSASSSVNSFLLRFWFKYSL